VVGCAVVTRTWFARTATFLSPEISEDDLAARQVRRTPEEAVFNSLLLQQQDHDPGYPQPVGEHLNQLVYAQTT
jgi:hypothetical protein